MWPTIVTINMQIIVDAIISQKLEPPDNTGTINKRDISSDTFCMVKDSVVLY